MSNKKLPIKKLKNQQNKQENNKDFEKIAEKKDFDCSGDKATLTTRSLNIKTLEDALNCSNVDLESWEVDHYIINSWEVTMGCLTSGSNKPETFTNYQVKVWLKRKVIQPLEIAIENIFKTFKPTKYPKVLFKEIDDPHLLEICLFDHHFGKLAWYHETNNDYDLKIAKKVYQNGVFELLNKVQNFNIEEICLPIGQDFFHVNNPEGLTPKGKINLDTDGRLAKVFETGIEACIKAIETCLQIAPVSIIWVPGNHDPETSYYLCKVLQHHFLLNKNFSIDVNPTIRKYKQYGISLIGFTHGSEEPIKSLPTIMADEKKDEWSKTIYHEWHTGHFHKKKEMNFLNADSFGSTIVRTLPSLSGTDHWHYKKGFVKGHRAAECYLWSKEKGYTGHFSSNILED
jgi:hypothetical protein